MTVLPDASARARIEHDLVTTFVVEAAAGTGKTTALVSRILAVVRSGLTTLERVVAVTFTEKAAGEMKLRLRMELERARESADSAAERERLERALAALEVAHINTIHGFCSDLLRERPIEAGIDPAFCVLDEAGSAKVLHRAFHAWFERILSSPPEGVRRVLRRRSFRAEGFSPREQLLRACACLAEHRDFDAPWALPDFDRARAIDDLVQRFRGLGALAGQARSSSDPLARALTSFQRWVERLDAVERARPRDHDGIEAELGSFEREHDRAFTGNGQGKLYGLSLDRQAVLEQRTSVQRALQEFLERVEVDLAARLWRELAPVLEHCEVLKRKEGAVDFVDLLLAARDLLKRDARVRGELQQRFTHLFVDEFQDTDPLQAEILLLLAADDPESSDYRTVKTQPGKLFVVGDPKQSIYRFRRADVVFYERMKRGLLDEGAELLHLTTNFRSFASIQGAVNGAFSRWMTGAEDGSQARYVPLSPYRPDPEEQPTVIALPVPEPYGMRGRLTKKAVNESFPDAVGAFVRWLLEESGYQVNEGAERVRLSPRHVCLLFRRFQAFGEDLTHQYVRGLEARRIPHVLVGGRSFHGREEVMAVRTALEAIEWPDDELSVYATLRGPLFGVTDEELLCFRAEFERLRPLRRLDAAERERHPAVSDGLTLLRVLHFERNRRPFADTVEQLLAETRAHAAFAMWPTGEQALANALSIVDLAHMLETRGAGSFRGFLEALSEQAERGEKSEAPIIEEGTEGVRLMTVHKAKGLEFPVVILCDPTAPAEAKRGTRYVDFERRLWAEPLCGCRPLELLQNQALVCRQEEAENVRLAYVAATRARDLLVVPVFGDGSLSAPGLGWVDALAPSLYPPDNARRSPLPAPACPSFGEDSVLKRPAEALARPDEAVAPGLHRAAAGENLTVWWDPGTLELGVESLGGVRQQELLAEPQSSDGGIVAHARWKEQRAAAVARSSRPTLAVSTITAQASALAAASRAEAVAIPTVQRERSNVERAGRPRGARFGTLVHAVLAEVPLTADVGAIQALASTRARLLGANSEEERAAVTAVSAALAHPLLLRARASADVRREVPVVLLQEDGTLTEGVIDLAFREASGWTVIDFKTDQTLPADEVYTLQLGLYLRAVETATGEPASGVLFSV